MFLSLTKEYFQAFSNKDIKRLKELFDKDIYLNDWELEVFGLNDVTKLMEDLFEKNDLRIEIKKMYCDKNTVISEIQIFNELNKFIKVVDILEFNDDSKIVAIRAYKG